MSNDSLTNATSTDAAYEYPFRNPDLPLETRVNDLVSRFTLEEKINLMCQYQDAVERLGVNKYKHGTEAAHGVAWLGEATTFPQPIGLACTWDQDLLHRIGEVISIEARGFFRRNPELHGLTLWSPTVDMERDPRWGRTEEAYGEDPVLAGKLAASLSRGMRGDHPFYVRAVASLKHFLGNNNELDRGSCSVSIDPRNMREYYLKPFEIPFREGGTLSMMTAYNAINGVPANLNPDIIRIVKEEWGMNGFVVSDAMDVLGTVNDHGYYKENKHAVAHSIKSGIDSITDDHPKSKQAIREALDEGLLTENDLDVALRNTFRVRFMLGEFDPDDRNPYAAIGKESIMKPEHAELSREAARKNIVLLKNKAALPLTASKLDKAAVIGPLGNVVCRDWYSGSLPYAVSVFDGVAAKLGGGKVSYYPGSDHIRLKSALTGRYVGLLDDEARTLAASADAAEGAAVMELIDWGWGSHTLQLLDSGKFVTSLNDRHVTGNADEIWGWFTKEVFYVEKDADGQTLSMKTWNQKPVALDDADGKLRIAYEDGASAERFAVEKAADGMQEAVKAAQESDAAIVVVGNHPLINGKETMDRPDITLPESQVELIKAVHAANPNTIVVIVGSYPYAIGEIDELVPAIVYTSHAGQELGNAVADVLFGDCSPAGRLNMTWYRSVDQLPDMMEYDIIRGRRTYQYFDGDPLYPFGYGLTYGKFAYSNMTIGQTVSGGAPSNRLAEGGRVTVSFDLHNIGTVASDEVPQLYVRVGGSRVKRPLRQLLAFERIHLAPGEKRTVTFEVKADDLRIWDVTRDRFCLENAEYTLMIGRSSADIELTASLDVDGETIPPRNLYAVTRAVNYDNYEGVVLGECTEGGSGITDIHTGDWLCFQGADLSRGLQSFEARVAAEDGPGAIEIRIDSPDSALLGRCEFPATGGAQSWHTYTCALSDDAIAGEAIRDVYLVFEGSFNLSTFRLIA